MEAAADYGIEVTQLRDNLALPVAVTVAERVRCRQIAFNTVEEHQKAGAANRTATS